MAPATLTFDQHADLTDAELVGVAINGREGSFDELVSRYQRPIAGYVYRILGNYDATLDVTQEVFIKVHRSLRRFRPEYKFSTWLYRIAHNAAIDHIRRNSFQLKSLDADGRDGSYQFEIECPSPSPERIRERNEWRIEINEVIRRLPPGYRDLVLLRHANDLRYDEIVEVTGLPLGTVKNRLFRARAMMRSILIERGVTGP